MFFDGGPLNRRRFLFAAAGTGTAALKAAAAGEAEQPRVAITMDDFALNVPEPWRGRTNQTLLDTLNTHRLKAGAFVAGARIDSPEGLERVDAWRAAGHLIGNHTYSHRVIGSPDFPLPAFEDDVLRNERLLGDRLSEPKMFRFPALKEGKTASTRDEMRAFLKAHGYRNGAVTIDASDWYYDQRLRERLKTEPGFDVSRYREPYLAHIRDRAQYYDALAREVVGRRISHTLLIHYNLLNVLFLSDVLKQFTGMGWKLIDAQEAYRDPVFRSEPQVLPAGESLVWSLAKATGRYDGELRYPGEDDRYEKPLLDRLGL